MTSWFYNRALSLSVSLIKSLFALVVTSSFYFILFIANLAFSSYACDPLSELHWKKKLLSPLLLLLLCDCLLLLLRALWCMFLRDWSGTLWKLWLLFICVIDFRLPLLRWLSGLFTERLLFIFELPLDLLYFDPLEACDWFKFTLLALF